MSPTASLAVVWHELECHGYHADLPVWMELAAREPGPILDVGAGTGRVAVPLARAGHDVTALDVDAELLAALPADVPAVVADAQDFDLGRRFGLILVPMQTVQLLSDRAAFLRAARAHLLDGGLLAAAVAGELEPFEGAVTGLPLPDVAERDGWRFSSQPLALRTGGGVARIERVRTAWAPDGRCSIATDAVELALLAPERLEGEGRAAGLRPEPSVAIPPTEDHVGATVVMLRA